MASSSGNSQADISGSEINAKATFMSSLRNLMAWAEANQWEFYQYRPWGCLFSELCRQAKKTKDTVLTSACQHPFLRMEGDVLPREYATREYCVADFALTSLDFSGHPDLDLFSIGMLFLIAELKTLDGTEAPWDTTEGRHNASIELGRAEIQMRLQALLGFARHPRQSVLYTLAICGPWWQPIKWTRDGPDVNMQALISVPLHMFSLPSRTQLNPWLRKMFSALATTDVDVTSDAFVGTWFELSPEEIRSQKYKSWPPTEVELRDSGNEENYKLPSAKIMPRPRRAQSQIPNEAQVLARSPLPEKVDIHFHRRVSPPAVIEDLFYTRDGDVTLEDFPDAEPPASSSGFSSAGDIQSDDEEVDQTRQGLTERHTSKTKDTRARNSKRPVLSPDSEGKEEAVVPHKARRLDEYDWATQPASPIRAPADEGIRTRPQAPWPKQLQRLQQQEVTR
ncbi:hypothetical protein EIP91_009743 [Steccherinum ochraceum]|uniref:Uncharacterized protein n=1 Tax=Steccherinum ochraceum TaxID=92696 RepID=A0A4R0R1A5_9APHY|nr:hypothetical protein EIP91_009743 [Steccherinum ochraceum]